MDDKNYINIQGWMINQLELNGNELILYAIIYGFSQDGESEYFGSQRYISKAMGVSLPTANKLINKLIKKGYIKSTSESHYIIVKEILTDDKVLKKVKQSVKKSLTPRLKKLNDTVKESLTNNNTNNNYNNNIYIIFNFWNSKEIIKHKKITKKMEQKLNSLLKDFDLEEIKKAIENYNSILKSKNTYWTHKWTLEEFLGRENGARQFVYKTEKDFLSKKQNNKPKALQVNKNKYE